jgi:HK97 family phage major capsid protein
MKYADILREQVAKLEEERAALVAESTTLDADDESRTAAELDARADEIIARRKAIKEEIDAKLARAAELDAIEAERDAAPVSFQFQKPAPKPQVADVRSMNTRQISDMVLRSIGEHDVDDVQVRSLLKRHGSDLDWARNIAARSTEAYASAFQKYITGRFDLATAEERAAIAVGTNTQGGYLVPTFLDPTVILTNSGSANAIRQISRVVTLTTGNTWNGVTSAGVTASWDGELVEVSDDSPSFGNAQIPTYQAQALVQASIASFEDIAGLASDVLMMFGDAKDRLEGTAHATGSGSGQPTGIFTTLNATASRQTVSTTAATIGLVDLTATRRALGQRWRGRASWVMNPVYADAIRALGTALGASYSVDVTGSNTDTLLGRPVVETDDAPSTQTTTAKDNEIAFGDFSNYVIVDKPGSVAVEFIPHLFNTANNLPDGRRAWFMHYRSGAKSVNDAAFSLLVDKTSA